MLAAVFDPFHRASSVTRCERNEEVLGVEFAAGPEPAADVVLHDLDGALGQFHLPGERAPIEEQHLGTAGHRELSACGIPFGEQAARLHRERHVALGVEALAPDIGRVLECRRGIAPHGMEFHGEIGARLLEQKRFIGGGRVTIGNRRQRLDVGLDQRQRVLGDAGGIGEHQRDRLPDVADLGFRDHRLPEPRKLRQRLQAHGHPRHPAAEIPGGEHAMDARKRQRRGDADGANAAMRHRAAKDGGMQRAGAGEIVHVLAAAAQKAEVLQTLDRAADERVDRPHARPSRL